jgi:aminoglycoside N3'-acetyltransferase
MASTHVARALRAWRTRHPVYSFVVADPDAPEVAQIDWAQRSVFGDDSIFGWFSAMNANYLMLGIDAYAQVHRSEHLAGVPYHSHLYVEGLVTDHVGTRQTGAFVYARDIPDTRHAQYLSVNGDLIRDLAPKAVISRDLSACRVSVIDARAYDEIAVPALRKEPYTLLKPENVDQVRALVEGLGNGSRR